MNVLIGVILLVLALVLFVIGVLATTRKLPGNRIIGLRVPEVRKAKEVWDSSHAMAGPLWLFGGVTLLFGGLIAFVAAGWLWLLPPVTLVVAVVAVASGANIGARTATVLDAQRKKNEEGGGGCSAEGGCDCGGGAPAPEVDLAAVRRAADASNAEK